MTSAAQEPIEAWHQCVNDRDLPRSTDIVTDPIIVAGPRGIGTITPVEFAAWVERSGIRLTPLSWHPVDDRLSVVEQDAVWPENPVPTRVATVFRVTDGRVSAALRFADLDTALHVARSHSALAATP